VSGQERLIEEVQSTFDTNVFVMMRYSETSPFRSLEESIRSSLQRYGLRMRLAKDRSLHDDLWENIRLYMTSSRYGIAVFEQIHEREFNPNISLELGYMYALGRRCLLLKDRGMPRLPTDACGKIYRDFDPFDIEETTTKQVTAWCENDLGLSPIDNSAPTHLEPEHRFVHVIYDSAADENFSNWGMFDTTFNFVRHIELVNDPLEGDRPGAPRALEIRADGTEWVGVHMKVRTLHGMFVAEYSAVSSTATSLNIYLCIIPMQNPFEGLLEVGAERIDDPANAFSPYRIRRYVPHHEIADESWHTARLNFDFRLTPDASYAICAIRINEGCPHPGAGALRVRNLRVFSDQPPEPPLT
jgi:hypothetical protein